MWRTPEIQIATYTFLLMYINELPKISNLSVRHFADDTVLITSGDSLHTLSVKVNEEIAKVENWLSANKSTLNLSKLIVCSFLLKRTAKTTLT